MGGMRARLLLALALVVAIFGGNGPSFSAPPATAQVGPLFREAPAPPSADARDLDPTVVRQRYVSVDLGMLNGAPRAAGSPTVQGDLLPLNLFNFESQLFPDVSVTAIRDRVEASPSGRGYVWVGHVQGRTLGSAPVTIAVENNVMVANIRVNGSFYQVRYAGNGLHVVQ